MRSKAIKLAALFGIAVMALLAPSRATADGDEQDPPSRVARLSYMSGAVSFSPAGTDDWVTPVVNRPITTDDKLWTDKGARAELSIGTAYIRMGDETGFAFLNLDDRTTQIRITEGVINLRVKRLEQDEIVEVDTPNLAFTVDKPGSYRIDVNENGDTTVVAVEEGGGEVTGGGESYTLNANESGTFSGTDQLDAAIDTLRSGDEFDQWCADRDQRYERSTAARYVSDDVVGYEDLDDYGGWRSVPEYGTVWFPHTTVVGWAPYRYGHWVWVSPWGWTWVDDEPWGFAPFHYGRWVVVGGVWGWVPVAPRPRVVTAVYVRPVYAPALVAWVGGAHWGVGIGIGGGPAAGVAWFPLGPRDVYCPSYHVSERYVERVNISNTRIINRTYVTNVYNTVYVDKSVNVTNIRYQNRDVRGAVTATSRTVFTSAQPVGRNVIRVNEREITSAPVAPITPGVAPQRRSVVGAGVQARVRPPERVTARPVVVRTAPPPASVKFERQQQAIESRGGRPLSSGEQSQLRRADEANSRNIRMAPPARPVDPRNDERNRAYQPPQRPQTQSQQNQPQQVRPQQNRPPDQRPGIERTITPPPVQAPKGDTSERGRRYNDRPPASRSYNPPVNPAVEQRQQQQMEQLRQKQDNERQKVEQRQIQQQRELENQRANEQRQQQLQQRQTQQLQQMERRHDQQAQKLEQKQQREVQQQRQSEKPQRESKPPKENKPPSRHSNR